MELEDLDSINKNDFLPLLPLNIKQELLDNGGESGNLCDSVEKQVSLIIFYQFLFYFMNKKPQQRKQNIQLHLTH